MSEFTAEDFAQEKAGLDRQGLVDHIQELDAVIRRRNKEVKELRVARDELRKIVDELHAEIRGLQAAPLSLDTLAAAWEAAEVPTDDAPIREGDVVIYTSACGTGVTAHKAAVGRFGRETHGYVRILSRAPKPREPWADLADVRADMGHLAPTGHAKALYERGVRISKNGRE